MDIDNIEFNELSLSTITVEGALSNIKFNLYDTIEYILYNVIQPIIDINNINTIKLEEFYKIQKNDLNLFMYNIINNDFTLFQLIINSLYQLYGNDNYDKIYIEIQEYNKYNNNSLKKFKEYCNKIYTLLFTINSENNDIIINNYDENIQSKLLFILTEYNKLFEYLNSNINVIDYTDFNKVIKFNYIDVKNIYSNISDNIDIVNVKQSIIELYNIKIDNTILNQNLKNYECLLDNIIEIQILLNEYTDYNQKKINDIYKLYNNINNKNLNIDDLKSKIIENINYNKEEWDILNNFILKIGCNYGEYISEKYIELTKKPIKSKRGRKPKPKTKSNRRKQGMGTYMTSQLTFTIVGDGINDEKNKLYHIKIFVNGVIQIPAVMNEDINIIIPYLEKLIKYINKNVKILKIEKDKPINIKFIKSIMRNYKFHSYHPTRIYNIKLNKLKKIINQQKEDININNLYNNEDIFKITEIKYNPERYPGCTIKFDITNELSIEEKNALKKNKIKQITIKIFSSGKINIDGANTLNSAKKIQRFLLNFINNNKENILYEIDD